jgi:predicted unusual protein kinase regulating ubiquinone biosynthesis (AarF/ABC1/UbiB family)
MKTWDKIKAGAKWGTVIGTARTLGALNKDWGKKYLVGHLEKFPGVTRKMGQYLAMRQGVDPQELKPQALPLSEVREIIEKTAPTLAKQLVEISDDPYVASIGQVHRGRLKSGELVAVKVQLPGVREGVEEQLNTMLELFNSSPMARNFHFPTEEYRAFLGENFNQETDYTVEAIHTENFSRITYPMSQVVVPTVFGPLSSEKVLVQSFESGRPFHQLQAYPRATRARFALLLMASFWRGLARGVMHGDLWPNNIGFRFEEGSGDEASADRGELVLYDFGSVLQIPAEQREIFWEFLQGRWSGWSDEECRENLVKLGFVREEVNKIDGSFHDVLHAVFRPFGGQQPWFPRAENYGKLVEQALEQHKWTFRFAGPPWLFWGIKSFFGLVHCIDCLDLPLNFPVVRDLCEKNPAWPSWEDLHEAEKILETPFLASSGVDGVGGMGEVGLGQLKRDNGMKQINGDGKAKNLRVTVYEGSSEVVALTMPVASVENLELLIPEESLKLITEAGVDVVAIKERAIANGLGPQELFAQDIKNRHYKVWLE